MSSNASQSTDYRRTVVLVSSIILLCVYGLVTFRFGDSSGTARFVAGATGRVGMLMAALWLAWPSLRKPAQWLPPGIAVLCLLAIIVIAAQPRLVVAAIPAIGFLLMLGVVVRWMKGS